MTTENDAAAGLQGRPARLLTLNEVCERVSRSRWWIRSAIAAGKFPSPVSAGTRSPLWVEGEIDAWIASLIAERNAARGAAA